MGPEARLQTRIRDHVRQRGGWCTKAHQSGLGERGVPDLLCCYRGLMVAVEVKNPDGSGRLSVHQARQIAAIQRAGGVALVADRLEDVSELLDAIDEGQLEPGLTARARLERIAPPMGDQIVNLEDS